MTKDDVGFCYFCTQNWIFISNTGAKAHTKLREGKTSMNKRFPIKKYTIESFFHSILRKTNTSGMRGGTFAVFFSQHPGQLERNGLDCRQRQHLFYFSTKSYLFLTSVAEMEKESREHSFQLIYLSNRTWLIHQLNTSYIAKNAKMSYKKPVTTCVTAF